MPVRSTVSSEESNPLLFLGIVFFLVICLLVFSGSRSGEEAGPSARAPGSGGGAGILVPGAPLDGMVGSPVPDAPPYTIVDDIRQTMRRYPDRNLPKDWHQPAPK